MDMYNADMEYRLDWRADLVPSYEDIVFCREIGWKDEEEAVEARDGVCNMTDMFVFEFICCSWMCSIALTMQRTVRGY